MARIGEILLDKYEVIEISNKGIPMRYKDVETEKIITTDYGYRVTKGLVKGHTRRSKNGKKQFVKPHLRRKR